MPLAVRIIDQAYIVDSIGRGIFGSNWNFEHITVDKGFEFIFYFLYNMVGPWNDIERGKVAYKVVVSIWRLVREWELVLLMGLVWVYWGVIVDSIIHFLVRTALLTH